MELFFSNIKIQNLRSDISHTTSLGIFVDFLANSSQVVEDPISEYRTDVFIQTYTWEPYSWCKPRAFFCSEYTIL